MDDCSNDGYATRNTFLGETYDDDSFSADVNLVCADESEQTDLKALVAGYA